MRAGHRPPHRRHRRDRPSTRPPPPRWPPSRRRPRPLLRRARPLAGARRGRPRRPHRRDLGRTGPARPAPRPAHGDAVGRRGRPGLAGRGPAVPLRRAPARRADQRPRLRRPRPPRALRRPPRVARCCWSATTGPSWSERSPAWSSWTSTPRRATRYEGGWLAYLEERATARRHAEEAYDEYADAKDTLVDRARRQREWAVQGVARRTAANWKDNDKFVRKFQNERSENLAGKVRQSEKALQRLETDAPDKPLDELGPALRDRRGGPQRPGRGHARGRGRRARRVHPRSGRPGDRLGRPGRHRRAERRGQVDAARRPARPDRAGRGAPAPRPGGRRRRGRPGSRAVRRRRSPARRLPGRRRDRLDGRGPDAAGQVRPRRGARAAARPGRCPPASAPGPAWPCCRGGA